MSPGSVRRHWLLRFANRYKFFHAYRAMCPTAWTERWDELRGRSRHTIVRRLPLTRLCREWNVSGETRQLGRQWIETVRMRILRLAATELIIDRPNVIFGTRDTSFGCLPLV
jgi:hypothetical protein